MDSISLEPGGTFLIFDRVVPPVTSKFDPVWSSFQILYVNHTDLPKMMIEFANLDLKNDI